MSDLIDRHVAIDEFGGVKVDEGNCTEYDIGYNDGIDFAVSRLSVLPSVDAVEIVRCRDCKHNPNDTWFECPISHLPYNEDRWCWKGEKKDG